MTRRLLAGCLTLGLLLAAPARAETACDLEPIRDYLKLQRVLTERAIEIVQLGATGTAKDVERLAALVEPHAEFNLGSGDADEPLGEGVAGAQKLAAAMNATRYIVAEWPGLVELTGSACGTFELEVEFLNEPRNRRSIVGFTFVNGRLTLAEGGNRHYETGALTPPQPQ